LAIPETAQTVSASRSFDHNRRFTLEQPLFTQRYRLPNGAEQNRVTDLKAAEVAATTGSPVWLDSATAWLPLQR
jgi:hypothetical protein